DPGSSLAFTSLGLVLSCDLIGREFEKGFDFAGSEAALRKAKELDPSNIEAKVGLAILLEHNAQGVRYASDSRLDEAITEYRAVQRELVNGQLANNLPVALLRAGQYREVKETTQSLPSNPARQSMIVAAIAAGESVDAALREINRLASNDETRRQVLAS